MRFSCIHINFVQMQYLKVGVCDRKLEINEKLIAFFTLLVLQVVFKTLKQLFCAFIHIYGRIIHFDAYFRALNPFLTVRLCLVNNPFIAFSPGIFSFNLVFYAFSCLMSVT